MNYRKTYDFLIQKAKENPPIGYSETHHIHPKCLGGSDEPANLVVLSARAHFLAHRLLVKIYPGVIGLSWAAFLMSSRESFNPGRSRTYAALKEAAAADISREMKGRKKAQTPKMLAEYASRVGRPLSDEAKAKISAAHKGRIHPPEVRRNMAESARNRPPMSVEARRKLSASLLGNSHRKGKPNSEQLKARIRAAHLGRKQSQEEKDRRAAKIRRISDETILKVRQDAKSGAMTKAAIAERNGISPSHVGRILSGQVHAAVQ